MSRPHSPSREQVASTIHIYTTNELARSMCHQSATTAATQMYYILSASSPRRCWETGKELQGSNGRTKNGSNKIMHLLVRWLTHAKVNCNATDALDADLLATTLFD
uniref:Uncharacterized protein n=1 Tax=Bionectria ochroleuca TaxID=29856 RepID=A0A8H7NNU6_BIOOC